MSFFEPRDPVIHNMYKTHLKLGIPWLYPIPDITESSLNYDTCPSSQSDEELAPVISSARDLPPMPELPRDLSPICDVGPAGTIDNNTTSTSTSTTSSRRYNRFGRTSFAQPKYMQSRPSKMRLSEAWALAGDDTTTQSVEVSSSPRLRFQRAPLTRIACLQKIEKQQQWAAERERIEQEVLAELKEERYREEFPDEYPVQSMDAVERWVNDQHVVQERVVEPLSPEHLLSDPTNPQQSTTPLIVQPTLVQSTIDRIPLNDPTNAERPTTPLIIQPTLVQSTIDQTPPSNPHPTEDPIIETIKVKDEEIIEQVTEMPPIITTQTLPVAAADLLSIEKAASVKDDSILEDIDIHNSTDLVLSEAQPNIDDTPMIAPRRRKISSSERARRSEYLSYARMGHRLQRTSTSISSARRGIERLQHQVCAGHCEHYEESKPVIRIDLNFPVTNPFIYYPKETTKKGRSSRRTSTKWKFTWIGLILFLFSIWYFAESIMCAMYCKPEYSSRSYRPDAPFFPWAIPSMIDRIFFDHAIHHAIQDWRFGNGYHPPPRYYPLG